MKLLGFSFHYDSWSHVIIRQKFVEKKHASSIYTKGMIVTLPLMNKIDS